MPTKDIGLAQRRPISGAEEQPRLAVSDELNQQLRHILRKVNFALPVFGLEVVDIVFGIVEGPVGQSWTEFSFVGIGGQNEAIRNQPSQGLRLHTVQLCCVLALFSALCATLFS